LPDDKTHAVRQRYCMPPLTCERFGGFKKGDKGTALLRKLATASRP